MCFLINRLDAMQLVSYSLTWNLTKRSTFFCYHLIRWDENDMHLLLDHFPNNFFLLIYSCLILQWQSGLDSIKYANLMSRSLQDGFILSFADWEPSPFLLLISIGDFKKSCSSCLSSSANDDVTITENPL